MRALRWLKGEYAAGRRHPPLVCDACDQDEGPIEAHSEDYSFVAIISAGLASAIGAIEWSTTGSSTRKRG